MFSVFFFLLANYFVVLLGKITCITCENTDVIAITVHRDLLGLLTLFCINLHCSFIFCQQRDGTNKEGTKKHSMTTFVYGLYDNVPNWADLRALQAEFK